MFWPQLLPVAIATGAVTMPNIGPMIGMPPLFHAVVVRVANVADSGRVSLLASRNRVVAIRGAEGLGKNWRRAEALT